VTALLRPLVALSGDCYSENRSMFRSAGGLLRPGFVTCADGSCKKRSSVIDLSRGPTLLQALRLGRVARYVWKARPSTALKQISGSSKTLCFNLARSQVRLGQLQRRVGPCRLRGVDVRSEIHLRAEASALPLHLVPTKNRTWQLFDRSYLSPRQKVFRRISVRSAGCSTSRISTVSPLAVLIHLHTQRTWHSIRIKATCLACLL